MGLNPKIRWKYTHKIWKTGPSVWTVVLLQEQDNIQTTDAHNSKNHIFVNTNCHDIGKPSIYFLLIPFSFLLANLNWWLILTVGISQEKISKGLEKENWRIHLGNGDQKRRNKITQFRGQFKNVWSFPLKTNPAQFEHFLLSPSGGTQNNNFFTIYVVPMLKYGQIGQVVSSLRRK